MIRILLLLVSIATLQACAVSKQQTQVEEEWGFHARFALRSPEQNQSGNLIWKQYANNQFEVKLWGTLGLGTTVIKGNEKGITVSTNKETIYFDADDTIQTESGLTLPFGQISQQASEILLNADPHSPVVFGDNKQWKAQTLSSVSYTGFARPTKIRLSNAEQETQLKLAISRWL